jgi:hypothetical protein
MLDLSSSKESRFGGWSIGVLECWSVGVLEDWRNGGIASDWRTGFERA